MRNVHVGVADPATPSQRDTYKPKWGVNVEKSEPYQRQSIRLKHYDYSQEGYYFITICTQNRLCLFGEIQDGSLQLNECGGIAEKYLQRIPEIFENTAIDCHVIMPNHVHFIIQFLRSMGVAGSATPTMQQKSKMMLPKIIQQYKTAVTKELGRGCIACNPNPANYDFKWQRNYYEHIIRDEESLNEIRKYISENPLLWEKDTYFP